MNSIHAFAPRVRPGMAGEAETKVRQNAIQGERLKCIAPPVEERRTTMSILQEPGRLDRLVEKCKRGDQKAWRELVDSLQRLVYSIPKRMGLSEDDSADVFQATFTALYRNLDRIDNAQTLPKWVAVTASREALRIKRFQEANRPDDSKGLDEILADEDLSAEKSAIQGVQAEILWENVDNLGGRCQELLRALYAETEVAYEEISEKLGMPIGAIGPTRARCLDKLRKMLRSKDFFD